MSIQELANQPQEILLGKRKILISRMSIAELYGPAESKVISDYKANMISIASNLTGPDKIKYLTEATREIPKGAALMAAAGEQLGTPDGYFDLITRAFNKHQKIEENEILQILAQSSDEEKTLMISYLMGTDYDTAKQAMEASQEDAKKK